MVGFIVSAILIIGGVIMYLFPSKNSNWVYGYRTKLSMKNQDTWKVSQKIGGFSMIVFGIIFLIITLVLELFLENLFDEFLVIILLIGSILMLIFDEMYLRKIFNRDGSRK